ncbi:MAG: hypothetical protein M0P97_03340 [Candidatus Moranbacteria bacterium]|jgi:hypothetical protein|nr:hypothetical protein [Candidatus Moranbacteria bacterium]
MRKLHIAVLQIATRKGEKLTSGFEEGRLQDWARDFEGGKISASDAVSKVKGEFSHHWTDDDYRELEKAIK